MSLLCPQGFKNKAFVVQVMAYNAWRALISNFARDLEVVTNPRRLKLLLMPLLVRLSPRGVL